MVRKLVSSSNDNSARWPAAVSGINLTLMRAESGEAVITVSLTEFITYSQNTGFTRINLKGRKVLDVKETTDQIDRLVRAASAQGNFPAGQNQLRGTA